MNKRNDNSFERFYTFVVIYNIRNIVIKENPRCDSFVDVSHLNRRCRELFRFLYDYVKHFMIFQGNDVGETLDDGIAITTITKRPHVFTKSTCM